MENKLLHQFKGFQSTPPLWHTSLAHLRQFKLPPVTITKTTDLLAELPSLASNFVLGKRMESFFELNISHSKSHNLLASNIQVPGEKETLGEIDFLIEEVLTQRLLHVELVYKFYIYKADIQEEMKRWVGPNRKDSLMRKLKKLKEKQLPLIQKPQTQVFLEKLGIDPPELEQRVCFKANLFIPRNEKNQTFDPINRECIAGYWIRFEEFSEEEYGDFVFFSPKKPDWPILPKFNKEWFSFPEMRKQILHHFERKKSPLIWMKKNETEYERFFVVWW